MKHLIYLMALTLFVVSQTAQGAVLDSCDQWASYCSGSYCCYNAVWDPQGSWSQCITAQSATQWSCTATHPSNGVKSYPNSGYLPSTTVGASISGSVSTSGGSGDYCLAWDVWAPQEVMIWMKWAGAVGIWGSYVTTDSIGGRTYDVYKNGYPGFMVQSQTSGGTFDIGAILNYCVNKGWLSSGATVTPIQCGFELTGCSNMTCNMNSFSVSVGGAATTTTAAGTTSTTSTAATTTTSTTASGGCTVTPYVQVNDGSWQQTTSVTVSSGAKVKFGPQPVSGGSWSWSGCGTSGSSREQTVYPTSSCNATATHYPSGGGSCSATFYVTVSGGGTTSTTSTAAGTTSTTAAGTTSTTSTAATTTTTSGGGGCDCGTCSWWGTQIPTCCQPCSGWGWQDGGCNRSCVCEGSCPNN